MTKSTDQRTCPGNHTPDRPAPGLRPDEYLCPACVGRTMHQLEEITHDLGELDSTISRQSVIRHGGTARRPEPDDDDGQALAREKPLPFNERAAEVRSEALIYLTAWARCVAGDIGVSLHRADAAPVARPGTSTRVTWGWDAWAAEPVTDPPTPRCVHEMLVGTCSICSGRDDPALDQYPLEFVSKPLPRVQAVRPAPTPAAMVPTLLAVLRSTKAKNWLRTDERGPTCAKVITYVRRRVRSQIDRYDRRWWYGPCGQPTEDVVLDGDRVTVVRRPCTADLYAEPGQAVVVCDGYREPLSVGGCGAMHPAVTRHKFALTTLRRKVMPLPAILEAATILLGVEPNRKTITSWRRRGQLTPLVCLVKHWTYRDMARCRTCQGDLFVGGQVLDLLRDDRSRPGPKRNDTDRRLSA